eukprot:TRINITY_DN10628_c0_g1_i1.p1 TRINITY_DN10628_c0_g1~~TRINITY_DN10628_c0_g1_i1.p1  ORF type:complete len:624 (+),score=128.79 TRINITY_DN10628_c0_g1_i1:45-1874(+)
MTMRFAVFLLLCSIAIADPGTFTHDIPTAVVAGSTVTITATNWDKAIYKSIQYKCQMDGPALYASLSDAVEIPDTNEVVVSVVIPNLDGMEFLKIEADVHQVDGGVHTALVAGDPTYTPDIGFDVPDCIIAETAKVTTSEKLLGLVSCTEVVFIKNAVAVDVRLSVLTAYVPIATDAVAAGEMTSMNAGNIINAVAKLLINQANNAPLLQAANTLFNLSVTTTGYVTEPSQLAAMRSLILIQDGIRANEADFVAEDKTIAASLGTKIAKTWANTVVLGADPLVNNILFGAIQTACVRQEIVANITELVKIENTAFSAQIKFTEPVKFLMTMCVGFTANNPLTVTSTTGLVSVIIDTSDVMTQPADVSVIIPKTFTGYSISTHTRNWDGAAWQGICKSVDGTVTVSARCIQNQDQFPLVVEHTAIDYNTFKPYRRSEVKKDTAVYVVVIAALVLLLLAFVCCCQRERRSIKKEATAYHERLEHIAAGKAPEVVGVTDLEEEEVPIEAAGAMIEQRKDTYMNENGEWEEVWDDVDGFIREYGEEEGWAKWQAATDVQYVNAPMPLETEYAPEQQYFDEPEAWAEDEYWDGQQEGDWQGEGDQQWEDQQWQQ